MTTHRRGEPTTRRLTALFAALVLVALAAPASASDRFEDVPTGNVFHDDIAWLAESGITLGCNPPANTRFCPDESVTRGQMAAFLVRALNLPDAPDQGLTDTSGSVFKADIDALAAADITKGCNPPNNTMFCPNDEVTRGQMAAFLVRALNLPDAPDQSLTDTSGSVFKADIDALAAADITKGCNPPNNTMFCPNNEVTRGQMAAFLNRALAGVAQNGLIAFTSDRAAGTEIGTDIFVMNRDGSGMRNLTPDSPGIDTEPAWSADGSKIAFASDRDGSFDIFVMNPDGTGVRNLTANHGLGLSRAPSFSPDGSRIVFYGTRDNIPTDGLAIFTMDADGGDVRLFFDSAIADVNPAFSPDSELIGFTSLDFLTDVGETWVLTYPAADLSDSRAGEVAPGLPGRKLFGDFSPDGSLIVFQRDQGLGTVDDVYLVPTNSAGDGPFTNLTQNSSRFDRDPKFSPDGRLITFTRATDPSIDDIHVMNVDGTGVRNLTPDSPAHDTLPAWQPRP